MGHWFNSKKGGGHRRPALTGWRPVTVLPRRLPGVAKASKV
jgi:hypothetical protein